MLFLLLHVCQIALLYSFNENWNTKIVTWMDNFFYVYNAYIFTLILYGPNILSNKFLKSKMIFCLKSLLVHLLRDFTGVLDLFNMFIYLVILHSNISERTQKSLFLCQRQPHQNPREWILLWGDQKGTDTINALKISSVLLRISHSLHFNIFVFLILKEICHFHF